MAAKLTLEDWRLRGEAKHGKRYAYLEVYSEAKRTFLRLRCANHGEFVQEAQSHVGQASGCQSCARAVVAEANSHTLSSFTQVCRELGSSLNYLEILREGKKAFKVSFVCPKHGLQVQGHQAHLASGCSCPICSREQTKDTLEDLIPVFQAVHGNAYRYTELLRIGGGAYVKAECSLHGTQVFKVSTHKRKGGCSACAALAHSKATRTPLEVCVAVGTETHRGKYAYGVYVGDGDSRKLEVYCRDHGLFLQRPSDHSVRGNGCPKCSNRISRPNLDIQDFVRNLGIPARLEHPLTGRKSIDVFCPDNNLAIEYHGNFWHSSRYKLSRRAHYDRQKEAASLGYRMIQLFSDEWSNREEACKLLISRALGVEPIKVHGRKCQVFPVAPTIAKEFLNTWHIQGAVSQGVFSGLYLGNQLVAVMCFNHNTSSRREKASRSRVELTRFASCVGVRGGFSKLLSHYLKAHPEIKTVVTYSDNRLFDGKMYKVCGFTLVGELPPDYTYHEVKTDQRKHKSLYQKSKLKLLLGNEFDNAITEEELAKKLDLYRIYDCGKSKWVLSLK